VGPATAAWTCPPRLLWSAPSGHDGRLGRLAIDGSHIYASLDDDCKDADLAPKGRGGIWQIDRVTGAAERISRVSDRVQSLAPDGTVLWFATTPTWCQRQTERGVDSSLFALALDTRRLIRVNLNGSSAVAGELLAIDGGVAYPTRGGWNETDEATPVPRIVRFETESRNTTTLAWGIPTHGVRAGGFLYFVDRHANQGPSAGLSDLDRVPESGGSSERLFDDLGVGFVLHGAVLYAEAGGASLRAHDLSHDPPTVRALVEVDRADGGTHFGILGVVHNTVLYVDSGDGSRKVQGVSTGGGPRFRVFVPQGEMRAPVSDDNGLYWIGAELEGGVSSGDGVYTCVP
jgi:hypothetical protein